MGSQVLASGPKPDHLTNACLEKRVDEGWSQKWLSLRRKECVMQQGYDVL